MISNEESMKDHLIDMCVTLARKSIVKYKHASVIVQSGKIIGKGFNKLYPKSGIMSTCHAEVDAILSSKHNPKVLKKSTLYVIRLSGQKSDVFGQSKPCPNCLNVCKEYNVSRIVYSTPTGFESIFI